MSTGTKLSMPGTVLYEPWKGPPQIVQAPIAITYLGSAIWSYMRRTTGAIFVVTVPATSITSAWRGEKRTTSAPKRLMSKRPAPTAMNSIAQQAVPRGNGQSELLRAQLNSVLTEVTKTFCLTSGGIGTSD